jgi:hypothetical protein
LIDEIVAILSQHFAWPTWTAEILAEKYLVKLVASSGI